MKYFFVLRYPTVNFSLFSVLEINLTLSQFYFGAGLAEVNFGSVKEDFNRMRGEPNQSKFDKDTILF